MCSHKCITTHRFCMVFHAFADPRFGYKSTTDHRSNHQLLENPQSIHIKQNQQNQNPIKMFKLVRINNWLVCLFKWNFIV